MHKIDEITNNISKFNFKYFPNWKNQPEIFYSNAIAGECGELCNILKHRANGGTNKKYIKNYDMFLELADIFIYMNILIQYHGIDFNIFLDIVSDKMKINEKRMEKNVV